MDVHASSYCIYHHDPNRLFRVDLRLFYLFRDPECIPDTVSYGNSDPYRDRYATAATAATASCIANGDGNAHFNADPDTGPHADSSAYGDAYGDAYCHSPANAHSDAGAGTAGNARAGKPDRRSDFHEPPEERDL